MKAVLFALTAATVLSGCASALAVGETSFACKEADGCPTPIEVYNRTHNTPRELSVGKTPEAWKTTGSEALRLPDLNAASAAREVLSANRLEVAGDRIVAPLRRGSQVARIWVAPWTDEMDRLHWARYTFVEVSPRRWQFGERDVRSEQSVPFVESQADAEAGLPMTAPRR